MQQLEATLEQLRFLCGPCRDVISMGQCQFSQFCTEVCEERTWAGGRGIAIVGAVTRKRLVTDWKHLDCVLLPPGRFLVLISVTGWVDPQGHSASGKNRSVQKSNDLIGDRTHGLPACSVVPQPTTLPSLISHENRDISVIREWPRTNMVGTAPNRTAVTHLSGGTPTTARGIFPSSQYRGLNWHKVVGRWG
jgi:hypothetical protein